MKTSTQCENYIREWQNSSLKNCKTVSSILAREKFCPSFSMKRDETTYNIYNTANTSFPKGLK